MSNDDDPSTRIIGAGPTGSADSSPEVDSDATVIRVPAPVRTDAGAATHQAHVSAAPAPVASSGSGNGNSGSAGNVGNGNMLPVGTFLAEFELTECSAKAASASSISPATIRCIGGSR